MLLTEYNEAEAMELFEEDGRIEGRIEGENNRAVETAKRMIARGKMTLEEIAEDVGLSLSLIHI